jgi:hypothetical protein
MHRHGRQGRRQSKVNRAHSTLVENNGAGLCELLPRQVVQQALDAEGIHWRSCLFSPLVTLWMFLAQVLAADGSCREAVARFVAFLAAAGAGEAVDGVGSQTGPYCKARQRLPEGLVSRLAKETGRQLHDRCPSEPRTKRTTLLLGGRKIKAVDGTTCSMPDTPENQKAWPHARTAQPGLGFPMLRLVVILSLDCAAVVDAAIGPYKGKQSGETALLRSMMSSLEKGDILLADRYYASYWMIAMLQALGVDSVFRQHQLRKIDFRRGQQLGPHDHVITLEKPGKRPEWMDEPMYEQMCGELTVREVRVQVRKRGFRVRTLVVVTTLLDAQVYDKEDIALAFRFRWHVELDVRAIKQTLNMDVLRCKTPAMVRKEIWMHLLAYNLIRTAMARAAELAGIEPREVSFAGAVQTVNVFAPALQLAHAADRAGLVEIMLRSMAQHRVADRPDRYEPRAVKRRAKPIALLTVPRAEARKRLARCGAAEC